MERLHILDGHGYIYRAYFALAGPGSQRLSTKGGMPTAALFVYAQMLIRLFIDERPERIAVVFDPPGRTFRNELDDAYKATRRETPEDLKPQLPYFSKLTEALGWPVICEQGVEADDVIATLVGRARAQGWDVVVYSGDKDLMQLVDEGVTVIDSLRSIVYDAARVEKKFGVPPAKLRDYLALVGDVSDNVPGMPGVGAKTAAKLLGSYDSIDGILAHNEELKGKMGERFRDPEALERLARSRELVTLRSDVATDAELDALVQQPWEGAQAEELFRELEFETLLERLSAARPDVPSPSGDAAATGPKGNDANADDGSAASSARPAFAPQPTQVALDEAALAELLAAACAHRRVAVFAESDGARPDRAIAIGLALAAGEAAPVYLPLAHRYLGVPAQWSALPEALRALLADPAVEIVAHDVKSLARLLRTLDAPLAGVLGDTMLAAYLLGQEGKLEVEDVAGAAVGAELPTRKSLLGSGRSKIGFEAVDISAAAMRAGGAAAAVLASWPRLGEQLEHAGGDGALRKLHDELELPLALLLAEIEEHGITLDVPYLRALADELGGQLAGIERQVYELAGEEFNLGSPKQLGHMLFEKLGLRADKMRRTKTGSYSTNHEILESMAESHAIIPPIIEHRELLKLKGTYLDALPPLVNPHTGRIHTSFNQAVAATGRLSSQDPNLQNIPIRKDIGRRIRRAFVAAPGKTLVSIDYSQIELRVMAHLSGDERLVQAFQNDVDVHTQTAAEVFDLPREEIGPDERRVAKAVNYGLMYGQSEFGLAQSLGISRAQAAHYMERYFERFSTVRAYMDQVVADARAEGAAVTLLGRRRPIPDLDARNQQRRRAAERVAQNTPVQGSAADIIKLAMLRVAAHLARGEWDASMLLTVHDELVFEVVPEQAETFAKAMIAEMEGAYALDVPLVASAGIADNWADAH
ncbi:DNA polymerase I [Haliangium ochraceum]|uniref:DNA polymerase I n=1 Tax=Haliangium ochraceum (strain DSM 14365 / JCM 11303 / SMP-2) TaxID=502025 RepID=D0LQ66_HALO1|nr:DNA polymerase I [Haliangium ochraceum]ACY17103.1 DNA polymerase I [Haliangium ochraceum DSM 14365]